ncbi:MAG: hypothetical protein KJ606_00015 [Chloroflexi bacterium]|nr:hypothetical protein [Chloroflexota bacterium]
MSATSNLRQIPPTPALVLAIGQWAREAVGEIAPVFLRSDRRRAATTSFLALAHSGSEKGQSKPAVMPVERAALSAKEGQRAYRQVYQDMIAAGAEIQAALETALHDLRTHERLLEVGLGDRSALPLEVIIVADLTDPSSAALFPLTAILQSLLAHEPYGKGHLLLNTAVFNPSGVDRGSEARRHVGLQILETLFDARQNLARNRLAQALGIPELPPLPFSGYLFDQFKEGTWEVKDKAELQVIVGNFILALLCGDLAQHLSPAVPQAEVHDKKAFYSSAAATALFFDPQALAEACAARFGAEIIAAEFLAQVSAHPRPAQESATDIHAQLGTARAWLEHLIANTPFELRASGEAGLNIHFADLRFEGVALENWAQAILAYDERFGQTQFPSHQIALEENAEDLSKKAARELEAWIEALPQQPRLYPAGPSAAGLALQKLTALLQDRAPGFSPQAEETVEQTSQPVGFEAALSLLEEAIRALPKPHPLLLRLPQPLKTLAVSLFNLVFLRREYRRINFLRQRCVRALEGKYAAALEEEARQRLGGLCEDLLSSIAQAGKELEKLGTILKRVHKRLDKQWDTFPPPASVFRPAAADKAVAEWVYIHWRKPSEEARLSLLSEHGFLRGWRQVTASALETRMLDFGSQVYQPLWQLSLDESLAHRKQEDAGSLLATLAQGALPLLRPDFDRIGSGSSYQARYFLCADPSTSIFVPFSGNRSSEWEKIASGDPYLAICCRVRHMIPLAALHELVRRGQEAWDDLKDAEQQELQLFEEEQ